MSAGPAGARLAVSRSEYPAGALSRPRGRTSRGRASPSASRPRRRGRGWRKASFVASPCSRMTRSARSRLCNAATCALTKVSAASAGIGTGARSRVITKILRLEERHAATHVDETLGEAVEAPGHQADGRGRDAHDVTVRDGYVGRAAVGHRYEVDGEGALLSRAEHPLHGGVAAVGGEQVPACRRERSAQREPASDRVRAGFLDPAIDEHAARG